MNRYINADKLMKDGWSLQRTKYGPTSNTYEVIGLDCVPTADVRENVKGEWQITDAYPHNVYCSNCHKKFAQTHWAVWEDGSLPKNFCPNCGADMRGSGV